MVGLRIYIYNYTAPPLHVPTMSDFMHMRILSAPGFNNNISLSNLLADSSTKLVILQLFETMSMCYVELSERIVTLKGNSRTCLRGTNTNCVTAYTISCVNFLHNFNFKQI